MLKATTIMIYLVIFIMFIPHTAHSQEKKSTTIDIGLFAATVSPKTEAFRYQSKNGYGIGGVAIILNKRGNFWPFIWGMISSFPEQTIEVDMVHHIYAQSGDESNTTLSLGAGMRFGRHFSDFKVFGEICITENMVDFNYYYYDDRMGQRWIGYQNVYDVKIGYSLGAGIGYKRLVIGYRLINGGGGNIIYDGFYCEFSIPIIKINSIF